MSANAFRPQPHALGEDTQVVFLVVGPLFLCVSSLSLNEHNMGKKLNYLHQQQNYRTGWGAEESFS